jgi:hypothetical protein
VTKTNDKKELFELTDEETIDKVAKRNDANNFTVRLNRLKVAKSRSDRKRAVEQESKRKRTRKVGKRRPNAIEKK